MTDAPLDPAELVRRTYNDLGATYDRWAASVRTEERARYLKLVQDRLPAGARVLDLGCGTGLLNSRPLAARYRVTGLDVSDRQIAEARRHVPDATFLRADVQTHRFDAASFDAIVSFYCLNHVPRASHGTLLRRFHAWLAEGGLLVCSFGLIDEEAWTGEWLGAPTFFSSHDRETTLALVAAAGFVVESATVEVAREDDREVAFLWVVTTRSSATRPPGGKVPPGGGVDDA